ncbi:hypothetical protein CVU83_01745 [Candidatus Falkowbacteria bacterium HGW-Falkowbacteria-2]|uniref:Uncharacterized protein n=1 Tax=Candidatus Falkowbacteria bacterium HGW-Falkowbacteria-2 TaxID=2013769 RepID=A0A2N2E0Z7_9BACT|nr:MAG: hypothetical protein CVU83_01745 [Candidatus Falkowbacteria bacterium HGW-Falkowbacteria-2]
MALKNSTSKSTNSFANIQKCLSTHGAQRMIFDYDQQGKVRALSFGLEIDGKMLGFKLPARLENVSRIMYGCLLCDLGEGVIADKKRDQVYKTAWANIRDWIVAQMAMIDTQMVKFEEVFLPYIVDKNNETLFEKVENKNFLLGDGK